MRLSQTMYLLTGLGLAAMGLVLSPRQGKWENEISQGNN